MSTGADDAKEVRTASRSNGASLKKRITSPSPTSRHHRRRMRDTTGEENR